MAISKHEQKIQLQHPQGKKAVRIDADRYNLLRAEIIKHLEENAQASFGDLARGVALNLAERKIKFQGSLNWYLEWVKLDLEAKHIIQILPDAIPKKYGLSKL